MELKSAIIILALGIGLAYVTSHYDKELNSVKSQIIDFIRKLITNFANCESAEKDKTKPRDRVQTEKNSNKKSAKDSKTADTEERLFTKTELWENYRGGKGSKGLYIAIMGKIYDVAKGERHYGPGGGYEFFAGRDGTKAYSTGEFNDAGLVDDLTGVEVSHFGEYENWVQFFEKDYTYIGKVIGNFYDENGQPTEQLKHAHEMMEAARKIKQDQEEQNRKFPTCNSEWTQAKGSRVWCTKKSGGIDRDWVGVPRLLKHVGQSTAYCVCIRNTGDPTLGHTTKNNNRGDLDYPYLREYENCDPNSPSCKVIRKKN